MSTWIELDLGVLGENLGLLRKTLGDKPEIIFVVKADAYGHGMRAAAQHAWKCGVKWFGVAHIDEALELRRILPDAAILVMSVLEPSNAPAAANNNITSFIVSSEHACSLSRVLASSGRNLTCHIKVDTGMGRLGFAWETAPAQILEAAKQPGLKITGICTHFASSDGSDRIFFDEQVRRFRHVVRECEELELRIPFKHVSNSGAIVLEPSMDLDGVRPGILLYGYGRKTGPRVIGTKPFLQWKTRLVQVKKAPAGFPVSYDSTFVSKQSTTIGTIDAGYADGYPRLLGNRGYVLAGGRRVPVAGRVTMNLVTVDLGPDSKLAEGDEVVLLGSQGGESIWADEIAGWCSTISYEILTGIKTGDRRVKGDRNEPSVK